MTPYKRIGKIISLWLKLSQNFPFLLGGKGNSFAVLMILSHLHWRESQRGLLACVQPHVIDSVTSASLSFCQGPLTNIFEEFPEQQMQFLEL